VRSRLEVSDELERDQVEEHLVRPEEAVLRDAARARVVGYLEFRHAAADPVGQYRQEAVHLAVEAQNLYDLATIDLEHTAEVVQRDAAHLAVGEFGEVGGQEPRGPGTFRGAAPP